MINDIYAKRLGAMPLQMLIAAQVTGEGSLMWRYDGDAGFNGAGEFEILGAGESSLIRYLKMAYQRQDSIDAGIDLAIYLIHQAGRFIPGCRGIGVVSIFGGSYDWLSEEEIAARVVAMETREKGCIRKIITG